MTWTSPARILLCATALAFGACSAPAQEAPAPAAADQDAGKAERLRRARERWEKLSPEERDGLLRRFERWSRLPPGEREEIRRRFDEIGGREGAAVVRRRMEDLRTRSPEQIQRMRMQAAVLGRLWERFAGTLSPKVAESWAALPPEARERMRHRFTKGLVAVGREAILRAYATAAERAAIDGADPEARRAAMASVWSRRREEVLLPRREELAKLPPAERKAREVHLLEEHLWDLAREGLKEKLPQIRAALEKALSEKGERGPRRGAERNVEKNGKDWFQREFGITQDDLGARWVARPLMLALHMRRPEARPEFLASVRPELLRIARLPAAEREEALKALLERIR